MDLKVRAEVLDCYHQPIDGNWIYSDCQIIQGENILTCRVRKDGLLIASLKLYPPSPPNFNLVSKRTGKVS